tara:strand:- start:7886 stop:8404 length:519 start_codon:yes stop_codon:yes gene_type:complete
MEKYYTAEELAEYMAQLHHDAGIAKNECYTYPSEHCSEHDSSDIWMERFYRAWSREITPRPDVLRSETHTVRTGQGEMKITVGLHPKPTTPFEVFVSVGKEGSGARAEAESVARMVSLALRGDIPLKEVISHLIDIRGPDSIWDRGRQIHSIADGIAKILTEYIDVDNSNTS